MSNIDGEVRDGEVRDGEVRDGEVRDGEADLIDPEIGAIDSDEELIPGKGDNDEGFIMELRKNISRNSVDISDLKLSNEGREKDKLSDEGLTPRSQSQSEKSHPKYVYASKFGDALNDSDGWTDLKRYSFQKCLWKLKYNRIISSFYLDNMKHSEQQMSWMIVVISTLTSGLTVANNVEGENTNITNYNTYINILLTVSSMGTSLIAAWIKKQMFIEKINGIDKFLIDLNALCEDLEIQLSLLNDDRLKYDEFKKKYIPQMTQYLTKNPIIPPNEWKKCIKEITIDYPELLNIDDSEDNKMWPWYGDFIYDITEENQYDGDDIPYARYPTSFYEEFKKTHKDKLRSSCCGGVATVSMY